MSAFRAWVIRCLKATSELTNFQYDESSRVIAYDFDVSCDDGRHHTGSVEFSYASANSDASITHLSVDGSTCQ